MMRGRPAESAEEEEYVGRSWSEGEGDKGGDGWIAGLKM